MRVSKLVVEGFCGIASRALVELPQVGLVLVTGRNGYGKTTLIEAVSHGVWGEGVFRDGSLWADKGTLEVHTHDGASVIRTRSGSRTTTSVVGRTGDGFYDTATKANAAAVQLFGDHAAWRAAHIVEPSDAAMFTRASDTVRKHVLETMLGLQVYDDALVRSRTFRKAADTLRETLANKIATCRGKLETLRGVAAASKVLRPRESVDAEIEAVRHDLTAARADLTAVTQAVTSMTKQKVQLENRIDRLSTQRMNVPRVAHNSEVCPLCNSRLGNEKIEEINGGADTAQAELGLRVKEATDDLSRLLAQYHEACLNQDRLDELVRHLERKEAEANRELEVWSQTATVHEQIAAEERVLSAAEEQLQSAVNDRDLYATVESVLGVRGVRAHILDNAVTALGNYTQQWMSRLSGGEMGVTVKSYTEGARETRNAISITLQRSGRSTPYASCSRGEQRRIDIAVTLALANLQSAANSSPVGTLFVDEIMDGLDDDGAIATLECLSQMAATRCVVVITHKASVQLAAKSAAHYMFTAPGIVERVK